jgi:pimeloyl-ACP methyl ester carboxylesterase
VDEQVGVVLDYAGTKGLTTESPILAGHSQGGIVARKLAHILPTDGIVTIGTPHLGHPLISSPASTDLIVGTAHQVAVWGATLFNKLFHCNHIRWDLYGNEVQGPCIDVWSELFLTQTLAALLFHAEQDLLSGPNNISDLTPNGQFLNNLNATASQELTDTKINLLARLNSIERPVSVYRTQVSEFWAPPLAFQVFSAALYLDWLAIQMFSGLNWDDPWFLEKAEAAEAAGQLGTFFTVLPEWWNDAVGGWPNDSFISTDAQFYDGAQVRQAPGIAHTEETESADIRLALRDLGLAKKRN